MQTTWSRAFVGGYAQLFLWNAEIIIYFIGAGFLWETCTSGPGISLLLGMEEKYFSPPAANPPEEGVARYSW